MSFPKLIDQRAEVAAALAELGVRHGDRVLIMLPDGPGFAESFAGAVHHDALLLPVSPLLPAHDLAAAAAQAGAPGGCWAHRIRSTRWPSETPSQHTARYAHLDEIAQLPRQPQPASAHSGRPHSRRPSNGLCSPHRCRGPRTGHAS